MQTATIQAGDNPVQQQNDVQKPQAQRCRPSARAHTLLQEPAIEHRESRDEDHSQDRQVDPEADNGEAAGRTE